MVASSVKDFGSPRVLIRRAKVSDAPKLASLTDRLGYPTSPQDVRLRLSELLKQRDQGVFVAEEDGQVVGWAHVCTTRRLPVDTFAEIGGLVVEDALRRRGIGQLLIDAVEGWALEREFSVLRVRTNSMREGARAFYSRLGFSEVKQQTVYVREVPSGASS